MSSDEFAILFITTLQQYWSVVINDVIGEYEAQWLVSFASYEKKTGTGFSLDDFLAMMQLKRMQCLCAKKNYDIPYDAWSWSTMIPYYDLLKSGQNIAPIFQTLASCVYGESLRTQFALERIGTTKKFVLQLNDNSAAMRRYWQMLCEGTNQYIFTVVFSMYIEALIQARHVPLRWCMTDDWHVQQCYIVDGVVINSEHCIPGCKSVKTDGKKICKTLNCWRRSHVWLLLVLEHLKTKKTRLVNFDITSALLGQKSCLKPRNIGCIPVNCGFLPFIWPGADDNRDASLHVERDGLGAARDKSVWKALAGGCKHIDDNEAHKMHENGDIFYAVASVRRIYSTHQIMLQLQSAKSVILTDLPKQKMPPSPKNRLESSNLFLQSVTRLEIVQTRHSIATVLSQMLSTSLGVSQLYEILIKLSL